MYNGILLFDKPDGYTSHDVIACLRGITKQRRIGHGGTLDPMATGLLTIFFGTATKACEYISSAKKQYLAELKLGISTDTQDITGKVIKTSKVTCAKDDFLAVLPEFTGNIKQIPPMYSAVWKNGQRLYDLARKGIEVKREARNITIYELLFLDSKDDTYSLSITASKGTYIRTLINDIGDALGCGAVMTALRRTGTGFF